VTVVTASLSLGDETDPAEVDTADGDTADGDATAVELPEDEPPQPLAAKEISTHFVWPSTGFV
jgi:hypothetical protein